jgi:drug/metabolite transporter (DMT)-like permease
MIKSSTKKGVFLAIASYACYAIASFIIKTLSASQFSMVFSRNFVGLLIFSPLFIWKKKHLKTTKLTSHFVRAFLSLVAMNCSIYGISHLNLGDAILLEQTAPFFIMTLLFIWKKEKISFGNLIAIIIAFIGVILIIIPQFAIFQLYSLASLASGFLAGICFIFVESLVKTETPTATLF